MGAILFNVIHRKSDSLSREEAQDEGEILQVPLRIRRNATVRWKLMLSFLIQAVCIGVSAALAQGHAISNQRMSSTTRFSSGNKKRPAE